MSSFSICFSIPAIDSVIFVRLLIMSFSFYSFCCCSSGLWLLNSILLCKLCGSPIVFLLNVNHFQFCMKVEVRLVLLDYTAQKMKFSIKDFLSKCDQIRRKLGIWSHILKKSLIENFIFFCAVLVSQIRLLFSQTRLVFTKIILSTSK